MQKFRLLGQTCAHGLFEELSHVVVGLAFQESGELSPAMQLVVSEIRRIEEVESTSRKANVLLVFHLLPKRQVRFRVLERGLLLVRNGLRLQRPHITSPGRSYPRLAPSIVVQLSHMALKISNQLDATSTIAYDRDTPPLRLEIRIPVGGVSQDALVLRQPWILRKLPRIEPPNGCEHKIYLVVDGGVGGDVRDRE